MANEKHLALSLAGIVTFIAVGAIAMTYTENNPTGSVTGIHELNYDGDFYLHQYQLVLIEPRGIEAQNHILSMNSIEVQQWFGDYSFTALVQRGDIPQVKLYAKVESFTR